MKSEYPRLNPVANILAQIVQFSQDDYHEKSYPDEQAWGVAYICACFLAQHTSHGNEGVDTEIPYVALKIGKRMPFDKRLKLAQKLVKEWDN